MEGTVDGRPLPIDLDALGEEGLAVSAALRRIKDAYSGSEK